MIEIIEPTREEKIAKYMKLTKRELAEMLATANEPPPVIDCAPCYSGSFRDHWMRLAGDGIDTERGFAYPGGW